MDAGERFFRSPATKCIHRYRWMEEGKMDYNDYRGRRDWESDRDWYERRAEGNPYRGNWERDTRGEPEWRGSDWGSGGGYGQGGVNWGHNRPFESRPRGDTERERYSRRYAPNWGPGNLGPNYGRNMDYPTARSFGAYTPPARNYSGRGPRGYRRSDERILEDVCERLTFDPRLDAADIEVVVNNGEVTLNGEVEDRHDKKLAEEIAEDAGGVIDVHNRLKARHGLLSTVFGTDAERDKVERTDREKSDRLLKRNA
jgi:hypothetical protein